MSVRSLPKTASRLRFEPRPSAPESSTLSTRLPIHPYVGQRRKVNNLSGLDATVERLSGGHKKD